jgi:3-methyl-2-oxobutanoate hydroxymethyltransferase
MSDLPPASAATGAAASQAMATPYGTLPNASPLPLRRPVSLPRLQEMRDRGEKITMLTAYDATFAAVADAAGVECILVGDSLGMVCQGLASTVGVSLETMPTTPKAWCAACAACRARPG